MAIRPSRQTLIGNSHALGHAAIDADHFAIADCWLAAMRCAPVALPFHIARLRRLMRRHFEHEAALVEATGTPFCRFHRREHEAMLALCDDAYALADRNWRKARALLRDKLPAAVRGHVISMDQVAVLVINTAAERARAPAPGSSPRP
jgi:hemerythrin